MIYGYARVSTDGQRVEAQVAALTAAGAVSLSREVASGAHTDRAKLRQGLARLAAGDVLMVTRLDRLARSTRDLLNTLAAITATGAGFTSLGDTWADTTTPHGRLMLTVLGGLTEWLLLDSRVVDLPMAYNPTFVILSFLKPLFFNSFKNEFRFSDNVGA